MEPRQLGLALGLAARRHIEDLLDRGHCGLGLIRVLRNARQPGLDVVDARLGLVQRGLARAVAKLGPPGAAERVADLALGLVGRA